MQAPSPTDIMDALVLQPGSRVPLHTQLATGLREMIGDGRLRPGDRLPGELDLVRYLRVSRQTVRYALHELASEGLLRRARGVGTTVAAPTITRSLRRFYAFAWEVRARGGAPRSEVINRRTMRADSVLAQRLDVPPDSLVERIELLRTADGEPLLLETVFVQADIGRALDRQLLELESLYDALEQRHGIRATHAREVIRPVVLGGEDARLLQVRPGSPAFLVERVTLAGNQIIEWRQSLVRGDRYLYSVELAREGADTEP